MRRLFDRPAPGNLATLFILSLLTLAAAGLLLLPPRKPSMERAEQHWGAHQFAEARETALSVISTDAHNSEAWCLVVAAHVIDRSEPDESVWLPVKGTPTHERFHSLFAYAVGLSLSPQAHAPESPQLLRDLGCVLDRLDQKLQALEHYRTAEKLSPDPESRYHILLLQQRLGWTQEFKEHMRKPEFFAAADPWLRMHFFAAEKLYAPMIVESARAQWQAYEPDTVVPSLVVGACWTFMTLHMAGLSRKLWYALPAFLLGVLSTYPTLALVLITEHYFPFDAYPKHILVSLLYAVLGIGLREETMKLLLAAPLLFLLRKEKPVHILSAAALVGLGFAIEENTQYYADGGAAVMGRFLTANFAHLALTGLAGAALVDALNRQTWGEFLEVFCMVVALHGLYDFFLIEPSLRSLTFLSSVVFIVLARMYFAKFAEYGHAPARRIPLITAFTLVLAVSCATAYVMLARETSPLAAIGFTAASLIGILLIAIVFYREFYSQESRR